MLLCIVIVILKKEADMKILAVNQNYTQNQNHKKNDVHFEALKVNADAIEGFEQVLSPNPYFKMRSLTAGLMHHTLGNSFCKLGKKIEAVIRNITGVESNTPLENLYNRSGEQRATLNDYLLKTVGKSDIALTSGEFEPFYQTCESAFYEVSNARVAENRKMGIQAKAEIIKQLTEQEGKAPEEGRVLAELGKVFKQTEEQREQMKIDLFDKLWDQEGTECNKLKKMVEMLAADADKKGHQVTKEDVAVYLNELKANEDAKKLADNDTLDRAKKQWFM